MPCIPVTAGAGKRAHASPLVIRPLPSCKTRAPTLSLNLLHVALTFINHILLILRLSSPSKDTLDVVSHSVLLRLLLLLGSKKSSNHSSNRSLLLASTSLLLLTLATLLLLVSSHQSSEELGNSRGGVGLLLPLLTATLGVGDLLGLALTGIGVHGVVGGLDTGAELGFTRLEGLETLTEVLVHCVGKAALK